MKKFLILFLVSFINHFLNSQCTPAGTDLCADANVLCGLDDMNGYTCQNPDYSNATGCTPLCPSGGGAHNTAWWAFVTNGGNVCLTITFSNCRDSSGVQFGIWGDCNCSESIFCDPTCTGPGQKVACGVLEPCKTYYLFVDGCTGDVCDFTIQTSGGAEPKLPPLKPITGPKNLCKGACNVEFCGGFANGNTTCKPIWDWTLDGVELDPEGDCIKLDFNDPGEFILCVTAVIGNPVSGSICDQQGPECITIKVTEIPDKLDGPRYICNELLPFQWQGIDIISSGEYRKSFKDKDCCEFDSVVIFEVLDAPFKPDIYFLGCKGDKYKDPSTGIEISDCQDPKEIKLSKSTVPFKCDSSYNVHAAFLKLNARIKEYCQAGKVIIEAQTIDETCLINGYSTEDYKYKWYKKNDPNKISLGAESQLEVDCTKEDYCVEITMTGKLDNITKSCTFQFCETQDESQFCLPKVCPAGDLEVCVGSIGTYTVNANFLLGSRHIWTVSGGLIITPNQNSSTVIDVLWNFDPSPALEFIGKVCYYVESNCPETPECCIDVKVKASPKPDAGPDIKVCGLKTQLQGRSNVGGGQWRQESGPISVINPENSPTPDVSSTGGYGRAVYIFTENFLECVSEDTVIVDFNESTDKGPITYICGSANNDFIASFKIEKGKPPYKIIKGNGTIDVNGVYTSKAILNLTNEEIEIEDSNGCRFAFIINYECKCSNEVGIMDSKLRKLCQDQCLDIIKDNLYDNRNEKLDINPRDTLIFFVCSNATDPLNSIVFNLAGTQLCYDSRFVFGTPYFIGAKVGRVNNQGDIDPIKGCIRVNAGTPFVFYEIPKPSAGSDLSVCGTTLTLQGLQSIMGSKLSWREKNSKKIKLTNPNEPNPILDILDGYGEYILILEEGNQDGLCVSLDEVRLTFNPNPEILDVDKKCLNELGVVFSNDDRYVVKAKLLGTAPFILLTPPSTLNGKIIDDLYCSDSLPSLTNFMIVIQDANGCISSLVQDSYNCNCESISAGSLDTNLIRVCEDQCVSIKSILKEQISNNDTSIYIVHKSTYNSKTDVLDTLYSVNELICFDKQSMKHGILNPIYVTRVVGDDVNPRDGIVDLQDTCKRVSNNMKIVFEPYAKPDAGTDVKACGLTTTLNGFLSFGKPQWEFISGPGLLYFSDPMNLNSIITVDRSGTYKLKLKGDNFNCKGDDEINITFYDSPEFIDTSIIYECDSVAEHYRIRINSQFGDRPSWNINGTFNNGKFALKGNFISLNSNTWVSDWIPNGNNYNLEINDIYDCTIDLFSGVYECDCITSAGKLSLDEIKLCSDGVGQVYYSGGSMDANDDFSFVLYEGIPNDPKSGIIIEVNKTGRFLFDPIKMILGKTYYISVFAGNVDKITGKIDTLDRCFKCTPGVPITWYRYPDAIIDGPNLLTCKVDEILLNATSSVSGSGSSLIYKWSTNETTDQILINQAGTYSLEVIDTVANCRSSINYIIGIDTTKPNVHIETPLELTCKRLSVILDGTKSDRGSIYLPTWSTNVNSYTSFTDRSGRYTLTIENLLTGCKDSEDIIVNEDKLIPMADILKLGDLTCSIDQISLDASSSKAFSGNISKFSWKGSNIISSPSLDKITIKKPGGIFIVEVEDSKNGCVDLDTIIATEIGNPLEDIISNSINPLCFGENNGVIEIKEVLDNNGNPIPLNTLTFSINGSAYTTNRVYNNLSKGKYTISIKDINSCILGEQELLNEPEKLSIDVDETIIVDKDSEVYLDTLLNGLFGGTKNNNTYKDTLWYNLNEKVDWKSRLRYLADTTRDFEITGIDQAGCIIKARVRVLVKIHKDIWWPNVFNPNSNKEENRTFNVYGKRVRNVRNIQIFDRWGNRVYSGENLQDGNKVKGLGWNGIYKGKAALPGVYAFVAEVQFEGSNSFDRVKGDFTLVR